MKSYTPELGQALFGNPTGAYECPELLCAALQHLDAEIDRVEGNHGRDYHSPLMNSGNRWENDTFSLRAYYWGDDEAEAEQPNFQYGDLEVRWYKSIGRNPTVNRPVTNDEIAEMLEVCLASVREMDIDAVA